MGWIKCLWKPLQLLNVSWTLFIHWLGYTTFNRRKIVIIKNIPEWASLLKATSIPKPPTNSQTTKAINFTVETWLPTSPITVGSWSYASQNCYIIHSFNRTFPASVIDLRIHKGEESNVMGTILLKSYLNMYEICGDIWNETETKEKASISPGATETWGPVAPHSSRIWQVGWGTVRFKKSPNKQEACPIQ